MIGLTSPWTGTLSGLSDSFNQPLLLVQLKLNRYENQGSNIDKSGFGTVFHWTNDTGMKANIGSRDAEAEVEAVMWNFVICPSEIVIDALIIDFISNVAAPSWGDAEEIGLCFYVLCACASIAYLEILSRAVLTFNLRFLFSLL